MFDPLNYHSVLNKILDTLQTCTCQPINRMTLTPRNFSYPS